MSVRRSQPVAEFKEFERRFRFKPRFKYGWFHLKLYHMFQYLNQVLADLNRSSNSLNSISGELAWMIQRCHKILPEKGGESNQWFYCSSAPSCLTSSSFSSPCSQVYLCSQWCSFSYPGTTAPSDWIGARFGFSGLSKTSL